MVSQSWGEALSKHPSIERLRETLCRWAIRPIWWVIPGERPKALDYSQARRTCSYVRTAGSHRQECQSRFLQALDVARQKKLPHQYLCPIQQYTSVLPVVQNGGSLGYLAMCHSERALPQESLSLAGLAVETTLQERERTQELKNLSEAIQPRCVALSTIHTIHRLISSTLNLEELLPRVARLCCQVLRAHSCAIWLMDREKRLLVPRTLIELKKVRGFSVRPCRLGHETVGTVASACQAHLGPKEMVVPLVEEEVMGVIMVRRLRNAQDFSHLDQEILTTLAEQAVVAIRNAQMYEAQERVTWGTIKSLSAILDGMEPSSSRRVSSREILADVAVRIAEKLGLPDSQQRPLLYAALLHDAGRVGIPQEILRKSAPLEPSEFAKVKEHPITGAKVLEPLTILEPAIPIILYHHERYDGTGYPKGLKKEAIPLGARILAVANAFEAMVCERPYRQVVSISQAAREIASHAGTQFDPKVVQAFLRLAKTKELEELVLRSR